MNWYTKPWKKYATFEGRAQRTEYWTFSLVNAAICIALFIVGLAGSMHSEGVSPLIALYILFALAIFLPSLAVCVRRLHDSGKGGAWVLMAFIPLVGGIILLILMLLDGDAGDNQFGPDPRNPTLGYQQTSL